MIDTEVRLLEFVGKLAQRCFREDTRDPCLSKQDSYQQLVWTRTSFRISEACRPRSRVVKLFVFVIKCFVARCRCLNCFLAGDEVNASFCLF